MRRLVDRFARVVEQSAQPDAGVEAVVRPERGTSRTVGGRTVFGDRRSGITLRRGQLRLF